MKKYFVDGKEVSLESFEDYLDMGAENIAKEDGIYYEWSNGGLPDIEYEEYIDNYIDATWQLLNVIGKASCWYNFEIKEITV